MAKQRRDPELVPAKQNFDCALTIRDLCKGGYHFLRLPCSQTFRTFQLRLRGSAVFVSARSSSTFHHIKCASDLGTELLKINLQCHLLWIYHNIQGTCKSSEVLRDRGSHPTLNTIADDGFSHRPTHSDSNPWFPATSWTRSFRF